MVYMKSLYQVQVPLLLNHLGRELMDNRVRLAVRVRRVDQVKEVGEGGTCVHHCIDGTNMRLMIPPKNRQWRDHSFVGS